MGKSTKNGKKAFTFAELMISLIVISVLSAILYPTIAQFTPNSNKPLFKSAYKSLSAILTEIIEEDPLGELPTTAPNGSTTGRELCMLFCQKANIAHSFDNNGNLTTCAGECDNTQNNKVVNTLTTSNGMRWHFNDYDYHTNPSPQDGTTDRSAINDESRTPMNTFQIFVDVNSSNNNLSQIGPCNVANRNNINIDQLFISNCTCDRNGGCGVFYFDNTCQNNTAPCTAGNNTGIYSALPNFKKNGNPIQALYIGERLKIQDTFEILIDKNGKIVAMSPAAWANLEDSEGD